MPYALLIAHMEMTPRLEAEEILRAASGAGLGFGGKKEQFQELERQARGGVDRPRKPRATTSPRDALRAFREKGFPVDFGAP